MSARGDLLEQGRLLKRNSRSGIQFGAAKGYLKICLCIYMTEDQVLINTSTQGRDNSGKLRERDFFLPVVEIEDIIIMKNAELDPWASPRFPIG